MAIPMFHITNPSGFTEFAVSSLDNGQCESLTAIGLSTVSSRMTDRPQFPYLGLIHRSKLVQLFAFVSCTGWVLLVGLEYGSFDSDEVARSFFERAYNSIIGAVSNPFSATLEENVSFKAQIANCIQSHSVMMTFMASPGILG